MIAPGVRQQRSDASEVTVTDVFISYASEDRGPAAKLASALGALGWSVWWDRNIVAGQTYDQAIERELETAKSVVVLWSKHSIASEWVKNEATVAAERGVLVPASIEGVKLPLEFRRKQTADLMNWNGDPAHSGFRSLCDGLVAAVGRAPANHLPAGRTKPSSSYRAWMLVATAVIIASIGFFLFARDGWRTELQQRVSSSTQSDPSVQITEPVGSVGGLAEIATGSYVGDVIADSKGDSRSDVALTISMLDQRRVRVTSDYERIGTVDIELTRIGNKIMSAGGDTPFILDLDQNPPSLVFDPHGELAYRGNRL
ncbi:toll/interleukin-1 receptor domain-containing protein [Mesorhizobium sp. M0977]|uniref:toll/interleukin-1 receptor domain-containing protein n=1 Tax=Mesorhizobium sp. M0977 TaxID=2957039 RepID=UPI00333D9A4C